MTTILVVDDMAVFREPIAASLRSNGFETISAANGREALQVLRSAKVDLMLLDVAMPVMDGLEVLRTMKDDTSIPRCPVILLTAVAEKEYVVEAVSLGARDYLLKSQFSLEIMLNRIRRVFDGQSTPAAAPGATSPPASAPGQPDRGVDAPTSAPDRQDAAPEPSEETDSGDIPPSARIESCPETADAANDQLKTLRPLLNRSQMTELLESCGEMKALSPVVAELLKLTNSSSASVDHIVKVIKRDQAIALKVLKLANSAVYTRGDPVDSLDQAVMRIGMGSIRQAVMNMAVIDEFGGKQFTGIDPMQFWEHSIACGLIGAEIARARMDKEPDLAFTMGLLHDVGRLVYVEQFADLYKQVFDVARKLQLPLERVETKLLLMNHADGMDRILHQWKFPKNLIDPIVFHHLSIGNMRRMASKRIEEVATLGLANRLTHAMLLGSSGNEVIYPIDALCKHLKVPAAVMQHLEDTIREQTGDIKFAMLTHAHQNAWIEQQDVWRKRLNDALRPLNVSMSPEYDAHRIFCSQLAERTGEPPNVGVVYVADNREVSPLSSRYLRTEQEAKVSGLPLIVLSPKGDATLSSSVMEGRFTTLLPTPVTIERFVAALNACLAKAHLHSAA